MDPLVANLKKVHNRVHISLKIRLVFYFVLSIAITAISIYRMFKDETGLLLPLIGFLVGFSVGTAASRILTISWDRDARKVVSRMDIVGVVILVLYTAFELLRSEIVGYFVHGEAVVAVSFSLLAGIMLGRLLGIRGKISAVFEKHNITS